VEPPKIEVAVPGARRRVFYFAAVISGEWLVFEKFREGFPKQVAKLLNTKAKTQRKLR